MNEKFYLGLAGELAAKLDRISTFVTHGPSIGSYHEEVLKGVLSAMLPSRFQLRTGFIYGQDKGTSQQGDILIVDENNPDAYYFREGNFVIANPNAVASVIEVKTKLDKKAFVEAITGLNSFRQVANSHFPATFVFAYRAVTFNKENLEKWYESIVDIPDRIENYPWLIYSLYQGAIILKTPTATNDQWGHMTIEGEDNEVLKFKFLSLFLQTIRKAILAYANQNTNPFKNALLDDLRFGGYIHRYGKNKPSSL